MTPEKWLEQISLDSLHRSVLRWYDRHGRDLPWRATRDPYRVWVSEVMLQQTLVATVTDYYRRFLERFPTIRALANSKLGDVLHAWQGLGYYRRARNLHQAAKAIVRDHRGKFPDSVEAIRSLPGLGRYTANAIACFAFGQRRPILEANTRRLWARVTAADTDPAKQPLHNSLWRLAETVLPKRRFDDFNQALMDIGSQVCLPTQPNCSRCPIRKCCQAFRQGNVDEYPHRPPKTALVDVDHVSVVLWNDAKQRNGRRVLVAQCPPDGRWAGLWEFPRVERMKGERWIDAASRALEKVGVSSARVGRRILTHKHGVMHYRVDLRCYEAVGGRIRKSPIPIRLRWVSLEKLSLLPFSSPQRTIVRWVRDRATESNAPRVRPPAK